jgi:Zn-dependent M28 family amino/carboxypeptidase
VNVVAWLPGRDTSRVVVIGGHMDSCICSANSMDAVSDAPGADDDGSGTVAVMELARVVSSRFPRGFDASIAFILYTGEELGLLGSTNFAARLQREGKAVTAAFTDDMVGNVTAEDGRVDTSTVRVFAVDSLALGRNSPAMCGRWGRCTSRRSRCCRCFDWTGSAAAATTRRSTAWGIRRCGSASGWRTTRASTCPAT